MTPTYVYYIGVRVVWVPRNSSYPSIKGRKSLRMIANGVRSSAFSRCSRRRRTRIQATLRSQRHSSAIGIRVISKTSRGAGALRWKTVALSCEQGA